jgi:hypothetical protein
MSPPLTGNVMTLPWYINGQMYEDHNVSRRARRKHTLSAEDLGILLHWHWKYGTSILANERQRAQMGLLVLLPNPGGDRYVLAMEVNLQFTKGHKRNFKRSAVNARRP